MTADTWRPLSWQARAVRWLLDPGAPDYAAINGGIGCGKSDLLAYLLDMWCRAVPGATCALISDSWPSLKGNNLPYLRAHCIGATESDGGRTFTYPNGSTIELRHYRLAAGAKESANPIEGRTYSLVVVDEAQKVPPVVLDHITGRMRGSPRPCVMGIPRGQRCLLNGRPDRGDWWWERAIGELGGVVFKPATRENPHNGPRYLQRLAARLSPAMFRCVTEGVPAPAEGGVYDGWLESSWPHGNILDGWRYDPTRPVDIGVDFGRRTPAVVYVQRDESQGVDVVFDELAPDECTTPLLVSRILRPWAERWPGVASLYGAAPCPWRIDRAYVDPAGNAGNVHTGASDVAILRRAQGADPGDGLGGGLGCMVVTTTAAERTSVVAGCERLRGAMQAADGTRRLVMTRELWDRGMSAPQGVRTLARSMLAYTWEMAQAKSRGGSDHWSTHHVDALRYWAIGARWAGVAPPVQAPPSFAMARPVPAR